MKITPRQRTAVYERDLWCCVACGSQYGLTIQHRVNRGMGGSKLFDGFAYWLTMCNDCNCRLEYDADFAELGRKRGWKLPRNRKVYPEREPVLYHGDSRQWLLDGDGERRLDEPAF